MNFVRKIATININAIAVHAKKMLLKEFIVKNDIDVAFLQEVHFDDFSFVQSHEALVNIGVTNKGTAILIRKTLKYSNLLMDPGGRIMSVSVDGLNLVNVYGHSGAQYRADRDAMFTDSIVAHFNKPGTVCNFLAGDFNCVLDEKDCKGKMYNFSSGLKTVVEALELQDAAVVSKNSKREFTFFRGDSASRLDRVYVSKSFCSQISHCVTVPVAFSDHHAVVIQYRISSDQRSLITGRGYWKINDYLLNETNIITEFSNEYAKLKNRRKFDESFSEWWSYDVKRKIKQFYKQKAFEFNDANRRKKDVWYTKLKDLCERQKNGENLSVEISVVKSKILEIEVDRLTSYACRLQPTSLLENEKIGLYHVSKINKRKLNPNTLSLKGSDGVITNQAELKNMVFNHYQSVFKESSTVGTDCGALNYVNKSFDAATREKMIEPFSEEELLRTIKSATKKKSPGPDGITYEFYLVHFDLLKEELLRLFNGFLDNSLIPMENFSNGIITLIPKTAKSDELKDFRPISLLNTDYKIFTKLIANRISEVIVEVIDEGQTAVVPGKSCIDNLDIIRTLVIKAQQSKNMKFALLSLDLEKAFDVVDHRRLWGILEKFGLPCQVITVIRRMYSSATSQILVNGYLTSDIKIGRSVRQGCPLSMALFVMYIEPVIRQIYAALRGILIENRFIKIRAFADDLTIIIRNNEEFDLVLQIISEYSLSSGISLNLRKSGFIRFNNCNIGPQMISENHELKILGLTVTNMWKDMIDINFKKLISNIKYTIRLFSSRRLNLVQKVIVLNTFLLSKLWYISQVIPPSNKQVAEIKMITGQFLWSHHKMFRVQRDQLYLDNTQGGLNLIDPETQCQSLFIRNLIYKSERKIDHPLIKMQNLKNVTSNTKKLLNLAQNVKNMDHLKANKEIYNFLLSKKTIEVKIVQKFPNLPWEVIWENTAKNYVSTQARSVLYEVFNDSYPNKVKMFNHNFANVDNYQCDVCGKPDTNNHRIKECTFSSIIWNWITEIVTNKLKQTIDSPEDMLYKVISNRNVKAKSALWLVAEAVLYNMTNYKHADLFCFKKQIREKRWNNRKLFEKHFDKFLNIC